MNPMLIKKGIKSVIKMFDTVGKDKTKKKFASSTKKSNSAVQKGANKAHDSANTRKMFDKQDAKRQSTIDEGVAKSKRVKQLRDVVMKKSK